MRELISAAQLCIELDMTHRELKTFRNKYVFPKGVSARNRINLYYKDEALRALEDKIVKSSYRLREASRKRKQGREPNGKCRDLQTVDYRDYKPNKDHSILRAFDGESHYNIWG